jgi:hypothetical protein
VYRPVEAKVEMEQAPHWASVLYVGSSLADEAPPSASPLAVALAAQDRYDGIKRSPRSAPVPLSIRPETEMLLAEEA